ncbi:hypothetical protein V6N11_082009 [Hibiscus sabdariffa]|uniref:Uncharacterized protein n=1 Tax=Hibiscus sabdariffa TaxID=183260 RepID=A0ABR1ZSS8_9ROSI
MHKECLANLQAKEAEWKYQREEMTRKLNNYSSQLESKGASLKVFEIELEEYLSSALQMKLQLEEISVMLLLLKSGMFEAQPKLANVEAELRLHKRERVENLSILRQQLEMRNAALAKAQREIAEERERTTVLSKRVETLEQLEDKHKFIQEEFNRWKEMLEESSRCQLRLKEQCLQVDNDSKEKIREVHDALNATNSELAEELENVASLLSRVESLDFIERQWLMTQKELESYKERLERVESLDHIEEQWLWTQKELERYKEALSMSQRRLEEQAALTKNDFGEKLREIYDALETDNLELVEERERTTSLIKRLESSDYLEEQHVLRQVELERYELFTELETSLLAQVEVGKASQQEKDDLVRIIQDERRTVNLQQQIVTPEKEFITSELEAMSFAEDTEDKKNIIEDL